MRKRYKGGRGGRGMGRREEIREEEEEGEGGWCGKRREVGE